MKAVNLIPRESRRPQIGVKGIRPSYLVVAALVVLVALIAVRVTTSNTISDRKATLAVLDARALAVQAEVSRLQMYTSFVEAAQQREASIRAVADSRFPWQRTFDQLARVLPAHTSLKTLSATSSATTGASTASATTSAASGLTIALAGCANTKNQDGVATLIRHLRAISGVTYVALSTSSRATNCGNSFDITLDFSSSTSVGPVPQAAATTTSTVEQAATTTSGSAG